MTDWQRKQRRRQRLANVVYYTLWALIIGSVGGVIGWIAWMPETAAYAIGVAFGVVAVVWVLAFVVLGGALLVMGALGKIN